MAAEDVGTSARMLVYHFGSKDELMAEALEEARRQQRARFTGWIAPVPGELYSVTLRKAWAFFESEQAMRYHRLFQQLAAASREPGSPHEGSRRVRSWTGFPSCSPASWHRVWRPALPLRSRR